MKRCLVALTLLAAAAAPAAAQSLFATRGLGVPMDPVDARSRALANAGLGLIGLNVSLVNPAELAGHLRRGVSASLQPFYGSDEIGEESADIAGTRFPVIQLIYPARERLVIGLGYGGWLDQSWAVVTSGVQVVGRDTIATEDLVSARGGIGQIRLTAAYELSPSFALGLAGGLYTGNIDREITRTFPDSLVDLRPLTVRSRWDYSAPFATVGFRIDPNERVRLSGAVTWSGQLDANPREGEVTERSFDLPLRASFGASAIIAPRLMAAVSGNWAGWDPDLSYAAPGTPEGTSTIATTSWDLGFGLESESLRTSSRVFPLRAGFRYSKLPFHDGGETEPREWAISGGMGFRLVYDDFGPLAVADIGVERGSRTGWKGTLLTNGIEETYWRLAATISLFGR